MLMGPFLSTRAYKGQRRFSGTHSFVRKTTKPGKKYSYKTSGAKDTILVKLKSLSSRATGPNTRVPLGFPS